MAYFKLFPPVAGNFYQAQWDPWVDKLWSTFNHGYWEKEEEEEEDRWIAKLFKTLLNTPSETWHLPMNGIKR